MAAEPEQTVLHASAVAIDGRALLIAGPSGSGKSSLAMQMIAHGAKLVSDDRSVISCEAGELHVSPPQTIAGMIEARGIGLLNCDNLATARVAGYLDLGVSEAERLPEERWKRILGVNVPLFYRPQTEALPAAMLLFLKYGRRA